MKNNVSIVISCAGMGTRLGLGCTKALVEIEGKTLIERHLEILKEYDDIRIVIGYQAENMIETVKAVRNDILFVFNHDYHNTGTGASFSLGFKYAREYVVALDGDLLVHPNDLISVVEYDGSCVCGTVPSTDDTWLMSTSVLNDKKMVEGFSREYGDYEWTGLAKIKTDMLRPGTGHVFQIIEPILPLPMVYIRAKEIDTMNDYDRAVKWIKNNYEE